MKRSWEIEATFERWSDVSIMTRTATSKGIFVATRRAAEVGDAVKVTLALPDSARASLVGCVMEKITPNNPRCAAPGFMLTFSSDQRSDIVLLESMAAAYEDREQPAGVPPCLEARWISVEEGAVWLNGARPPRADPEDMVELIADGRPDVEESTSTYWPPDDPKDLDD